MVLVTIVHKKKMNLIPVIYAFREKVKSFVLIYDREKEDINSYVELKYGISTLIDKYALNADIDSIAIDEDNRSEIESIAHSIVKKYSASRIILNATGADTALLVYFSRYIIDAGGAVVAYDIRDNSYNLIDAQNFENNKIEMNMRISDALILLGEKSLESEERLTAWQQYDDLSTIFSDTKRVFKIRKILASPDAKEKVQKKYPQIYRALKRVGFFENGRCNINIFGRLFERYLFTIMARYDFDDIEMGSKIAFEYNQQEMSEKESVINEFDILLIKENRIYFVEAKFGSLNSLSPLSIIYKSDALMDYFEDECKSMIVFVEPPTEKLKFGENSRLRASSKRIELHNTYDFSLKKFSKSVKKSFSVRERHFLLGGHDLEMRTIRDILKKCNQKYSDRSLSWGAKLSDYADILDDRDHFYAIELQIDIEPPKNFTLIDHHNEMQERASSLEQVADILRYPMDRYMRLVALNDSGYIPAMKKFGASQKEIEHIRMLDRKSQGVTQEEEIEAQRLVEESALDSEGLISIESTIEHFSPIVDRLYGRELLIYTDSKLTYYGRSVRSVVERFIHLVEKGSAYYGGGYGFFGIAEGRLSKKELEKIRYDIVDIVDKAL
jgi:hypothetical protein